MLDARPDLAAEARDALDRGFNLRTLIREQARLMQAHLDVGDHASLRRAEEYADAIHMLQEMEIGEAVQDCTTPMILTLKAWGAILLHSHLRCRDVMGDELSRTDLYRIWPDQVMPNPALEVL